MSSNQKNKSPDLQTLSELEFEHGTIAQMDLPDIGTIVLRGLNFGEYIEYTKAIETVQDNKGEHYIFNESIIPSLIKSAIAWPKNLDIKSILAKPGYIVQISNTILKITTFEDDEMMARLYVKALKNACTTYRGYLKFRLINTYGIDAIKMCNNMTPKEIVELLVYSELLKGDIGNFLDNVVEKPELIPQRHMRGKFRGQVDLDRFLGIKRSPPQSVSPTDNVSHKEVARVVDSDENIDFRNMSAAEYDRLKKHGKIATFDQQMDNGLILSKNALAAKIAEDQITFGEKKPDFFQGNVSQLLGDKKGAQPPITPKGKFTKTDKAVSGGKLHPDIAKKLASMRKTSQ